MIQIIRELCYGFRGAVFFCAMMLGLDMAGLTVHVAYDRSGPETLIILFGLMTAIFAAIGFALRRVLGSKFRG